MPSLYTHQRIKKIRLAHHLTRKEFSQILQCHFTTIVAWETNKAIPSPEMALLVSQKFNVSLDYIHPYYSAYYEDTTKYIIQYIKKTNISISQLAKKLNISSSTLKRFLHGKIKLSLSLYNILIENSIIKEVKANI